jgi:hypothetical protein
MASIKTIRAQIWKLERLNVAITGHGRHHGWGWANEASGEWTFGEWREKRFNYLYPNLTVNLKDGAAPQTKLKVLRGD